MAKKGKLISNTSSPDITQRKQMEEALRESEKRYYTLFKESRDAIYIRTREGEFVDVNQSMLDLFGYTREEMMGLNARETYAHPEDQKRFEQEIKQKASVKGYELKLRKKDGTEMDCLVTSTVQRAEDGSILGYQGIVYDITERKRAEEALEKSRAQMQAILDGSPDGIRYVDTNLRILWANKAALVRNPDVVGQTCYKAYIDREEPCKGCSSIKAMETGQIEMGVIYQPVVKGIQGESYWEDIGVPIKNGDGKVVGVIQITRNVTQRKRAEEALRRAHDELEIRVQERTKELVKTNEVLRAEITERKQVEKALRESEEKYRNLVERANDGITIIQDTLIKYANPRLAEVVGYTVEEVIDTPFTDYIHPDDLAKVAERYRRRMAGEDVMPIYEASLKHKDNSKIKIEINAGVITYQGKPADLVIVRDTSERKQMEEELEKSRAQMQAILDGSPDSIRQVDTNLKILWANKTALRTNPDVVGQTCYKAIVNGSKPCEGCPSLKAMETGQIEMGVIYQPFAKGIQGESYWEGIGAPIKDDDGKVTGLIQITRNVTQRKRAEEELIAKTRELEAASQAKSEFLAGMSHELRTPLNAIIGFSELMMDGITGDINDEQRQCLSDVLSSGQHLLNLINDVLDLAKVEARKIELKLENLELADVINNVVSTVKPMLDNNRHKLGVNIEEGLPQVRADENRLRQILLNLLSNAIKFTPPGGKLGIEVSRQGDWCQVSVVDNGIGIKPEDQERVFEAFIQTDALPDKGKEGTGLGLALTRQFVELCGGKIWIESEYGKGSKFTFTLPLAVAPSERPEKGLPKVKGPPLKPKQKRILVVDDDPKARRLLSVWLKGEGYAIAEASTGDEGIRKAKELLPAVIVLDILMPDKDGWQVLRELKSMPRTMDIPVVIVSVVEEKERCFTLGAVDYFVKPIAKERFLKRISELGLAQEEKVLVVDDNPADVRLIATILEAEGIRVLRAYGGGEGIRLARENEPTLIVLDILMPDLSGFEVIERLRRDEKTRDIPIIILTIKDLTKEEVTVLSEQATAIMTKAALRREDFLREVERVVNLGKR